MRSLRFISQFRQTLNPRRNPNFILTFPIFTRQFTPAPQQSTPPSDNVSAIVDDISKLTLLEVSDLMVVLRDKLEIKELPLMAPMVPGMRFNLGADGHVGGGGGGAAAGAAAAAKAKAEEKAEKTAFDVKLEAFDAASKIKVIKEVRGITALGLKEAKDLVEKAPTLLKKGVTKEEAEKIMEKMKEIGAKVTME